MRPGCCGAGLGLDVADGWGVGGDSKSHQGALLPRGPGPVGVCAWCQVLLRYTTAGAPRAISGVGAPTPSQNNQLSGGAGRAGGGLGPAPAPEPGPPATDRSTGHGAAAARGGPGKGPCAGSGGLWPTKRLPLWGGGAGKGGGGGWRNAGPSRLWAPP